MPLEKCANSADCTYPAGSAHNTPCVYESARATDGCIRYSGFPSRVDLVIVMHGCYQCALPEIVKLCNGNVSICFFAKGGRGSVFTTRNNHKPRTQCSSAGKHQNNTSSRSSRARGPPGRQAAADSHGTAYRSGRDMQGRLGYRRVRRVVEKASPHASRIGKMGRRSRISNVQEVKVGIV